MFDRHDLLDDELVGFSECAIRPFSFKPAVKDDHGYSRTIDLVEKRLGMLV